MNFQYKHQKGTQFESQWSSHQGTIIVDAPSKSELEQIFLTHSNKTYIKLGLSVKSDKDVFVKSIGRKLSETRLTPLIFDLDNVSQDGTRHLYHFHTNDVVIKHKKYHVEIVLTTVAESSKVRMIDAYFSERNGS